VKAVVPGLSRNREAIRRNPAPYEKITEMGAIAGGMIRGAKPPRRYVGRESVLNAQHRNATSVGCLHEQLACPYAVVPDYQKARA